MEIFVLVAESYLPEHNFQLDCYDIVDVVTTEQEAREWVEKNKKTNPEWRFRFYKKEVK